MTARLDDDGALSVTQAMNIKSQTRGLTKRLTLKRLRTPSSGGSLSSSSPSPTIHGGPTSAAFEPPALGVTDELTDRTQVEWQEPKSNDSMTMKARNALTLLTQEALYWRNILSLILSKMLPTSRKPSPGHKLRGASNYLLTKHN